MFLLEYWVLCLPETSSMYVKLYVVCVEILTAQKMKFSFNDFFSKRDQICRKLRIWSHLLKKSLMENLISSAVT